MSNKKFTHTNTFRNLVNFSMGCAIIPTALVTTAPFMIPPYSTDYSFKNMMETAYNPFVPKNRTYYTYRPVNIITDKNGNKYATPSEYVETQPYEMTAGITYAISALFGATFMAIGITQRRQKQR